MRRARATRLRAAYRRVLVGRRPGRCRRSPCRSSLSRPSRSAASPSPLGGARRRDQRWHPHPATARWRQPQGAIRTSGGGKRVRLASSRSSDGSHGQRRRDDTCDRHARVRAWARHERTWAARGHPARGPVGALAGTDRRRPGITIDSHATGRRRRADQHPHSGHQGQRHDRAAHSRQCAPPRGADELLPGWLVLAGNCARRHRTGCPRRTLRQHDQRNSLLPAPTAEARRSCAGQARWPVARLYGRGQRGILQAGLSDRARVRPHAGPAAAPHHVWRHVQRHDWLVRRQHRRVRRADGGRRECAWIAMTEDLVGGRYRLGQRIGVGGMGRVWLARDEVLHRDVAIKEVLLPEAPSEDEAYELRMRTLREARAAARLSHPNVVRVYDVMYADNRPWIVMEYVPSRSLAQLLKTVGPMQPEQAALVGLAVLDALCAAHAAGVLHRDVKPGNVLLADDGRVVLTDFGLATFDEIGSALTQSGVVHGSPQFIAPERAHDGTSTAESDMWSLGATLFAAVEGQSPYARATSYQTLAALATAPPDAPKRAGVLKPVLAGLLRRKPASRLKPDDVRHRLLRVAAGGSGRASLIASRQRRQFPGGGALSGTDTPAAGLAARRVDPNAGATPIEWLSANGSVVQARAAESGGSPKPGAQPTSDAGFAPVDVTSSKATSPPRPPTSDVKADARPPRLGRFRNPIAIAAAVLVLLGGGAYVATRAIGKPREANTGAVLRTPPATASSPASTPSSTPQPITPGTAKWPCDTSAPANPELVPNGPATVGGYAIHNGWTWFAMSNDFAIGVPRGWQMARDGETACFYDSTSSDFIGVEAWTALGTAASSPVAALKVQAQRMAKLSGYRVIKPAAATAAKDSAQLEYTFSTTSGTMHTFLRQYLTSGGAYTVSYTTSNPPNNEELQDYNLILS